MLWVGLDHFANEDDGLERSFASFLFEHKERVHQRLDHLRNGVRVQLRDLVHALDEQEPVLVRCRNTLQVSRRRLLPLLFVFSLGSILALR